MIALAAECLVFRLENGESVPLSPDMVSVELVGEAAPMFDPDFVTQAANAVFYYFKQELGRETVTVGEFTLALETALRGFNLTEENLAKALDHPGRAGADLCDLAGESGEGFELVFFPRLRSEVRAQLQQEVPTIAGNSGVAHTAISSRAQCSVMLKRSIVIAPVGQRTAHRPQRMHRSSSLINAASGRSRLPVRADTAAR